MSASATRHELEAFMSPLGPDSSHETLKPANIEVLSFRKLGGSVQLSSRSPSTPRIQKELPNRGRKSRKGHAKSRAGCLNCKRVHIKASYTKLCLANLEPKLICHSVERTALDVIIVHTETSSVFGLKSM